MNYLHHDAVGESLEFPPVHSSPSKSSLSGNNFLQFCGKLEVLQMNDAHGP